MAWLNAIIDSQLASNKSREQARHNKTLSQGQSENIVVHESMKSQKRKFAKEKIDISRKEASEDDIVNIADLLKFKDKYEYTESEAKSKLDQPI